MKSVKVSPKFQVVIPQDVREAMKLTAGTSVQIFQYEDRIEFIPQKRMKKMRGFLKGIDTRVARERDRV